MAPRSKHKAPPFRDMKAAEYNETMEALGLTTHGQQAAFLRCVIRTTWGYSNGTPIPRPLAMLLRLMRNGTDFGELKHTDVTGATQ